MPDEKKFRDFQGGPVPSKVPPLVPTEHTVYNLMEDEPEVELCPTCLEEYTEEHPKTTVSCGHSFHLSCILEWANRSDTCPFFCPDKLRCPGFELN